MTIMKSILLALHLVLVNLAAIGPLFCIGLIWRDAPDLQQTGKWLAKWSCAGLLIGMLLGGLIMGMYSFGGAALNGTRFYNALLQIPHARLWWGVAELAFYFLCMLPAVFFWPALMRRRWLLTVLLFLAATNLLYHFTPLFVVVGYLQGGTDFTPLTKPELRSLTDFSAGARPRSASSSGWRCHRGDGAFAPHRVPGTICQNSGVQKSI